MKRWNVFSIWTLFTMGIGGFAANASDLDAQGFSFGAHGGVAMPVGGLADVVDPGATFGLQVGHSLGERFAFGLRGEMDLLPGTELSSVEAPDMTIWRYGAGLEAALVSSPASRWSLAAELGVGATTFGTDAFTLTDGAEPSEGEFAETYLTSSVGLRVGFDLTPRVSALFGATGHWMKIDEEDTRALQRLDPASIETFSSAWSVPVTVGVTVRTGRRSQPPPPVRDEPVPTPPSNPRPPAPEPSDTERASALETLTERVHFDYDMSTIRPETAAALDRKIEILGRYSDVRLTIEGHCDERGPAEYNQALGHRRATAVFTYLVDRGISADRLQTTSMGKEVPLARASNEQAWAQNRRAEFQINNPESLTLIAR